MRDTENAGKVTTAVNKLVPLSLVRVDQVLVNTLSFNGKDKDVIMDACHGVIGFFQAVNSLEYGAVTLNGYRLEDFKIPKSLVPYLAPSMVSYDGTVQYEDIKAQTSWIEMVSADKCLDGVIPNTPLKLEQCWAVLDSKTRNLNLSDMVPVQLESRDYVTVAASFIDVNRNCTSLDSGFDKVPFLVKEFPRKSKYCVTVDEEVLESVFSAAVRSTKK